MGSGIATRGAGQQPSGNNHKRKGPPPERGAATASEAMGPSEAMAPTDAADSGPSPDRADRAETASQPATLSELARLLTETVEELAAARRSNDELQTRIAELQAARLAESQTLADTRRRAAGLQYRVDYIEEKLDQAKRELAWRRRGLFGRLFRRTEE